MDETINDAVEMYLNDRTVAESTLRSHRSRLSHFRRFCVEELGCEDVAALGPGDILRFKTWRFDSHAETTIKTQMDTLRVFLSWCEDVGLVDEGLHEAARSPTGGAQRSESLDGDTAEAILDHLETYQRGTVDHALLATLWGTGMRVGAAHSLDLDDLRLERDPVIRIRHRPETETPIKNQGKGERTVAIRPSTAASIRDYVDHGRQDVTDDHGRDPLFSSRYGRRHKTNLREIVYAWTRPCVLSGECPHDREIDDCEAAKRRNDASKCPSSISPHAIRRGSITHHLREDTPKTVVSDRCNVSGGVLDRHYDQRTESEKAEQRRSHLPD